MGGALHTLCGAMNGWLLMFVGQLAETAGNLGETAAFLVGVSCSIVYHDCEKLQYLVTLVRECCTL